MRLTVVRWVSPRDFCRKMKKHSESIACNTRPPIGILLFQVQETELEILLLGLKSLENCHFGYISLVQGP